MNESNMMEGKEAFVRLTDINKIYPNGVQAVYDFNIDIKDKEFIVLVGPSGCGKSTTLRMIAGLEDITSGALYIDNVLSNYMASKDRDISMVFQSYALYPQMSVYDNIAFPLKARKYTMVRKGDYHIALRDLDTVFSNPEELALAINESKDRKLNFANASIYVSTKLKVSELSCKIALKYVGADVESIANGKAAAYEYANQLVSKEDEKLAKDGCTLDSEFNCLDADGNVVTYKRHLRKEEIRNKVFEAAEILDLGPYLDRKPKELSGGQMQRVALGRAIVRNAKVFLMDEPLSNLDAKLRVQMRSEIVRLHERIGATTIYVTHDQTEAMTMATRIAVMSKGWVQQIDTPQVIYSQPNNIFVATFIGSPAMNIFEGEYENGKLFFKDGYSIDMPEDYIRTHDEFYDRKIRQTERLLSLPAVKKMHGLIVLDELHNEIKDIDAKKEGFTSKAEEISAKLNSLKEICDEISDNDHDQIMDILNSLNLENAQEFNHGLAALRHLLLNLEGITSKELGILHNNEAFSKNKKEDKKEVLFYTKRHGAAKKQVKGYKNTLSLKDSNIILTNNLYTVLTSLLEKYKEKRNGRHAVRIGIRPEHIHLDKEFNEERKSAGFVCNSDVVELLGSELLLHTQWNDVDMIAKISTGTLVHSHEDVTLSVDVSKVLVFDTDCGDTIADWVESNE